MQRRDALAETAVRERRGQDRLQAGDQRRQARRDRMRNRNRGTAEIEAVHEDARDDAVGGFDAVRAIGRAKATIQPAAPPPASSGAPDGERIGPVDAYFVPMNRCSTAARKSRARRAPRICQDHRSFAALSARTYDRRQGLPRGAPCANSHDNARSRRGMPGAWMFAPPLPLRPENRWNRHGEAGRAESGRSDGRVKATGVCHTDEFTLSGADPEGLFPAILGHEGAGIVVDTGPGVTSVKKGDHVIPLYTPECASALMPLAQDQSLHHDPRDPGPGPDAGRHLAVFHRGKQVHHYMGTSTFANYTVCRRSRSRKSARTRRSTRSATSAAASPPALAPC